MRRLVVTIATLVCISSSAWAGRCDDKFYPLGFYGLEPLERCLAEAAEVVAGKVSGPNQGSHMWTAMWGYCFTEYEASQNEMRHLTPSVKNAKDWLRGSWTLNYMIYRAMFEKWGNTLNKSDFSDKAIKGYCLDELAGEAWAVQQ